MHRRSRDLVGVVRPFIAVSIRVLLLLVHIGTLQSVIAVSTVTVWSHFPRLRWTTTGRAADGRDCCGNKVNFGHGMSRLRVPEFIRFGVDEARLAIAVSSHLPTWLCAQTVLIAPVRHAVMFTEASTNEFEKQTFVLSGRVEK